MIEDIMNFTYDAYVKFIIFLKKTYNIVPFSEAMKEDEPFLILRHDVDASLENALKMARMENELNIRSTYFVLFSSKLYNLLEQESLYNLRKISELGHEIGLHYDLEAYKSYSHNLYGILKNEIKLLETLLNNKIFSISCHNPPNQGFDDPFNKVKSYINAYDPNLCSKYVSDSCRAWYMEDLSQLVTLNFKRAQLLIHPFLWTEDICKRENVLERLFQDIEKKNKIHNLKWQKMWQNNPKVIMYEKYVNKQQSTITR